MEKVIEDDDAQEMGSFGDRLAALLKLIPKGRFTTYKELARKMGSSPRAVGQALRRNKRPIVVPCHRVVASDLSLGGYCGKMESADKVRLLESEGLPIVGFKVTLPNRMFHFD